MVAVVSLSLALLNPLSQWDHSPVLVVFFVGVDCPVSQHYAKRMNELATEFESKGVGFVGVDPNPSESAESIAHFQKSLNLNYPILRDANQMLASRFAITRTPEVIVLNRERAILYRGRVDDQYAPGNRRAQPTRHDLRIAIKEVLAGKSMSLSKTEPSGCPLESVSHPQAAGVAYLRDVAPILNHHCISCHQPGGIGPFPLLTANDAQRHAKAIREAVADRRMPPWHADPNHGHFANDPSLNASERNIIDKWAKAGAPIGEHNDAASPIVPNSDGWSIGEPRVVVAMPTPFSVPATGVIDYQTIEIDPGFQNDVWVQDAEIRPSNRTVVHHATVYLKPPGINSMALQGELQSFCLCAYAMGTPPMQLPDGMAKKIPAGWKLVFVIHYVANGTPQTDQTKIGLRIVEAKQVRQEVATNLFVAESFTIAPHQSDFVLTQSRTFDKDVLLLALFPHMHLRGVSFRYEASYPDGQKETLLSVPKWDMEWQHRYVLAEPKRLPAGTILTATAHYDNSSANPNNPNPNAAVNAGPRTEDEMFNGYYDFCLADQDLTKSKQWTLAIGCGVFTFIGAAILASRLRLCGKSARPQAAQTICNVPRVTPS